jgi:hypothetical protein
MRKAAGGGRAFDYLTIPYLHVGTPQQIRVLEPSEPGWADKHWQQVKNWYRGCDDARLREVSYWFRRVASQDDSIGNYAWASMAWLAGMIHLDTPIVPASALVAPPDGWGSRGAWVLRLCQAVRAKTYLSGRSGAQYLDFHAFERSGIAVEVQAYSQDREDLSGLHEYLTEGPEHLAYMTRRQP